MGGYFPKLPCAIEAPWYGVFCHHNHVNCKEEYNFLGGKGSIIPCRTEDNLGHLLHSMGDDGRGEAKESRGSVETVFECQP